MRSVSSSLKKNGPKRDVQEVLQKNINFVINFRRVKHFWLCLLETQVSFLTKDCANFTRECSKLPKLRTYNHIVSPFISHEAVHYTRLCLPFIVRKRLAQLRLGVLPLRIETDRYKCVKIPPERRFCIQPNCANLNTNFVSKIWHLSRGAFEIPIEVILQAEQGSNP